MRKKEKKGHIPTEQIQRVTVDGLGNIGIGKWKLSTEKMAKHRSYNGATWSKIGKRITDEEYVGLLKHAEEKGIKLVSFKNFDGDVQLIHEMIDDAEVIIKDFPKLKEDKIKLQIHNAFNMADDDYAEQEKGLEIISEVFSAIYSGVNNGFTLKYYKGCVKIIKERSGF